MAGVLLAASSRGQAQTTPRGFQFRALGFVAHAKPGNPYKGEHLPPFFLHLQDGSGLLLGPTPAAFLDKLRNIEALYEYRPGVLAEAVAERNKEVLVRGVERAEDPYRMALTNRVTIKELDGTSVALAMKGSLTYRHPSFGGRQQMGWNGEKPHVVLGRTYSHGGELLPNGDLTTLVFSVTRQ